uniref:Uncharacterized protein n=1 Tax=Anguilla anguilla TaxID=7936 RepID=A0A0E9Q9K6_ANGAN
MNTLFCFVCDVFTKLLCLKLKTTVF